MWCNIIPLLRNTISPLNCGDHVRYYSIILVYVYCKRRKFRGVINFKVFADATIPQNLFLGQQFTQLYYNAELNVVLTAEKVKLLHKWSWVRGFALHEILASTGHWPSWLASNRVLLAISASIFPVDCTFAIKIVLFYFVNYNKSPAG